MTSESAVGSEEETRQLDRLPNGNIEAPQRYIDYDGQLIIKTRYATVQRWKDAGWNPGRNGDPPYLLGRSYCTGDSEGLEPRHDDIGPRELTVHYVEDGDTVRYGVEQAEVPA